MQRRIPNEFVQLQSQAHGQMVRQYPFRQRARIHGWPSAGWIGKDRRKENFMDPFAEPVFRDKTAREFVVSPARDHEFDFIFPFQRFEVRQVECSALAGIRALHIHDSHHFAREHADIPFSARLD